MSLQELKDQLHKQVDECQDEERLRAASVILRMSESELKNWLQESDKDSNIDKMV